MNLAGEFPAITNRLVRIMDERLAAVGAPIPEMNPRYDPRRQDDRPILRLILNLMRANGEFRRSPGG